jgi:hypothetical protein
MERGKINLAVYVTPRSTEVTAGIGGTTRAAPAPLPPAPDAAAQAAASPNAARLRGKGEGEGEQSSSSSPAAAVGAGWRRLDGAVGCRRLGASALLTRGEGEGKESGLARPNLITPGATRLSRRSRWRDRVGLTPCHANSSRRVAPLVVPVHARRAGATKKATGCNIFLARVDIKILI